MNIPTNRAQWLAVLLLGLFLSSVPVAWSQGCGKCDGGDSPRSDPKIPDHSKDALKHLKHFKPGIPATPHPIETTPRDSGSPTPVQPPVESPVPYETFALFLFPNDQWTADNRSDIAVLRQVFENFGHAIGTNHLAVWLIKDDAGKEIDTERARLFCAKFGCPDDTGPHIILTSVNPDRWQKNQHEVLRLSLKGIRAERASTVLASLEEDLLNFRRGSPLPDRVEWVKIFEILRESINVRNLKEEIVVAFWKP